MWRSSSATVSSLRGLPTGLQVLHLCRTSLHTHVDVRINFSHLVNVATTLTELSLEWLVLGSRVAAAALAASLRQLQQLRSLNLAGMQLDAGSLTELAPVLLVLTPPQILF